MPSLIGLSPLTTGHPRLFQQTWVRSSRACYRTFNLPMARSLGFGSNPTNFSLLPGGRPFKTRFRFAYTYRFKLARQIKSLTHYTKGTRSLFRAPTDCRRSVSGSLSLPSSGCFSPFPHGTGSLSVAWEYLGLERGRPMFRQDFTCPALLKDLADAVSVRGYHPLMPNFPEGSGYINKATGLVRVRSPLLTESLRFPFLRVLRCFNSPRSPQHPMYSGANTTDVVGFPIRTSRDQSSLAAPPGLSQPNTSFIASMRQGIH